MLSKAMEVAKEAFEEKMGKQSQPYLDHAMRVADKMDTEVEKTVAMLHDVVEDTEVSLHELKEQGFPREVLEAVEILTKHANMTYFDYIDDIHCNELATKVKIAEIEDNKDIARVKKMSFQTYKLEDRANKALAILRDEDISNNYK